MRRAMKGARTRDNAPPQQQRRGPRQSAIADHGPYSSSCGYCHGSNGQSASHGMDALVLTVWDYQALIDRGWRRSGCFAYKPTMDQTCCPQYTIRLQVDNFQASKEQRRVVRRMERYLEGEYEPRAESTLSSRASHGASANVRAPQSSNAETRHEELQAGVPPVDQVKKMVINAIRHVITDEACASVDAPRPTAGVPEAGHRREEPEMLEAATSTGALGGLLQLVPQRVSVQHVSESKRAKLESKGEGKGGKGAPKRIPGAGEGQDNETVGRIGDSGVQGVGPSEDKLLYTSNAAFVLCSALKGSKAPQGQPNQARFCNWSPEVTSQKIVQVLEVDPESRVFTRIEAVKGHINFWVARQAGELAAAKPQQKREGHAGPAEAVKEGRNLRPHRLEITTERSRFILEEFELYKKYQVKVHNDPPSRITPQSYRRFLVDSPLVYVPPSRNHSQSTAGPGAAASSSEEDRGAGGTPSCGYGSFHQQYRLDGRLVAVGVVDVLPKCLSSKYFFWDPDFAFLSLGKYGALKEIEWVQTERRRHGTPWEFACYYLGYYIHTCPKMTYKGAYAPSELLCPLRYMWVPLAWSKPLLDESKYSVLSSLLPISSANENGVEGPKGPSHGSGSGPFGAATEEGRLAPAGTPQKADVEAELQLAAREGLEQSEEKAAHLREAKERIFGEEGGAEAEAMDTEAAMDEDVNEKGPARGDTEREAQARRDGGGFVRGDRGPCWPAELTAVEAEDAEMKLSHALVAVELFLHGRLRIAFGNLARTNAYPDSVILALGEQLKKWCEAVGPDLAQRLQYQVS